MSDRIVGYDTSNQPVKSADPDRGDRIIINIWRHKERGYHEAQDYMSPDHGDTYMRRVLAAAADATRTALWGHGYAYCFSITEDVDGTLRKVDITKEESK